MSSQPLYRIVYADGRYVLLGTWQDTLSAVRAALNTSRYAGWQSWRPVRVERVSPAPRATGGER